MAALVIGIALVWFGYRYASQGADVPTLAPAVDDVRTESAPTWSIPAATSAPILHRHLQEKELMLELVNRARTNAGLLPVELGDNRAAQLHAESSLANCTSSHWGKDGLKPYMRYSLAGGYQSNAENGHGLDYCITPRDFYKALGPTEQEVRDAVAGWLSSPGHRSNILDKWHKKVNIGLAWDSYNFVAYQHFEGDYVEYKTPPTIEEGILLLEGTTKNGITFSSPRDLGVQVYYDPPPHPLERGQLSRTYCYSSGLPVAYLREPLFGLAFWPTNSSTTTQSPCPDPYDVPVSAPAPNSPDEAHAHWEQAYKSSKIMLPYLIEVPWITARKWTASNDSFVVSADLGSIIEKHGNGVFTIAVWAKAGSEDIVISDYSIFYGIDPPETYQTAGSTQP